MGDEEVTTQDWVVGCSIRVLTKHTKEVRFSSALLLYRCHASLHRHLALQKCAWRTDAPWAVQGSSRTPRAQQHHHTSC